MIASDIEHEVLPIQLPSGDFNDLAKAANTAMHFGFGEVIGPEGPASEAVYLIGEGRARVIHVDDTGAEVPLSVLRAGAIFGATGFPAVDAQIAGSLIVRASGNTTVYKFDASSFRAIVASSPETRFRLESDSAAREIAHFLKLCTPFSALSGEALELMGREADVLTVSPGGIGMDLLQNAGPLCVLVHGELRLTSSGDDAGRAPVTLRRGELCGALLAGGEGSGLATLQAPTECRVIAFSEATIRKLQDRFEEFSRTVKSLEGVRAGNDRPAFRPFQSRAGSGDSAAANPHETAPNLGPFAAADGRFVKNAKRIRRFPHVKQIDEMDCGAACMAMVCRHFGRSVSITRIRQLVRTSTEGTTLRGLCEGAEALGLAARSAKVSPSRIDQMPLPAVIHWENHHWVVLFDISAGHAGIADPATGLRRISRSELAEKWNGYAALFDYTEAFEKAPESGSGFGWLMPFLRPFSGIFAKAFGLAVIVSALQALLPIITQVVVDTVLVQNDASLLTTMMLAMAVLLVFMSLTMLVQRYLLSFAAVRIDSASLDFIMRRLLALPLPYFAARRTGDIQRRILGVWQVREFLVQNGVNALTAVAQIGASAALMLVYSPMMALVFLGAVPVYAGLMKYSSRRLKPIFDQLEEAYGKYGSYQIDAIKGIETVKALGAERVLRENMLQEFHGLAQKQFRSNLLLMSYEGAVQAVGFLMMVVFLFIGARQVMAGEMTIGAMVAFNALVAMANAPIQTLLAMWDNWQMAAVLLNRMNDIFESEPEQGFDHSRLKPVRVLQGHVRLEHVSFSYGGKESPKILDNISLQIPPGKTVAIVGRSGSGKSTLVKCLAGLLSPTEGSIYFDGADQKELRYRDLRRHIGFVLQENFLFDDSIARNIAFAEDEPDAERVRWAARAANAWEFIDRLPLRDSTRVGEGGLTLSGGQRQRIAIARAIYNKPPILILDEATSALDSESERAVRENLAELRRDRTSFVIAHRLSTIQDADLILVLENGRIVEQGTHQELMQREGLYHYLGTQQLAV